MGMYSLMYYAILSAVEDREAMLRTNLASTGTLDDGSRSRVDD